MSVFRSYNMSEVADTETGEEANPLFCIISHNCPIKVRFTVRFTVLSDIATVKLSSASTYKRQALDLVSTTQSAYKYFQTLAPIAQSLVNLAALVNPRRHSMRSVAVSELPSTPVATILPVGENY